jgi:hypothetical protein
MYIPFSYVWLYVYRRVKFFFSRHIPHQLLLRVFRERYQVDFCYEGSFTLYDILIFIRWAPHHQP